MCLLNMLHVLVWGLGLTVGLCLSVVQQSLYGCAQSSLSVVSLIRVSLIRVPVGKIAFSSCKRILLCRNLLVFHPVLHTLDTFY